MTGVVKEERVNERKRIRGLNAISLNPFHMPSNILPGIQHGSWLYCVG